MKTLAERERPDIDPAKWDQLKCLIADVLEERSPEARTALVRTRCADDIALAREAESLLAAGDAVDLAETDSLEECAEHATRRLWDEKTVVGNRFGAYVVVRELGSGGMGAVYLAARADGQFEKEVAIKVLKRGTDTDEVLRRFASERHILARLDHPNIAHLLDAGTTDDGLPYFVMEYVAGVPITRFVREDQLSIEERLAIFLKVCAAVEVAHHNHVIHRDLKPSNILVNAEGEPKLLDFGIAKLFTPGEGSSELTSAIEQRLTPICASPEQTDGRPVTEASDVFALGALLYEILSGQKPHKFSTAAPSREELMRVIREEEPIAPSSAAAPPGIAQLLRGDLDAIILMALRKEPERRYPTVGKFAADVRRHLAGEPVLAREQSTRYRAERLIARHRRLPRLITSAVIVLLIGGVLGALWIRSAHNAENSGATPPALGSDAKSIAVLPFDSFGDNSPPSYFADGVQDNILTDLGKVEDLKVISRSGVAPYRGKARNAKQIGRELGVANVLQGSVQISGERVRINAQLIDTRTETQIWAQHYDRKVEDIFALQSELAQTIVAQLKATLSSHERAAIWKRPTEDMQAYDLYLRGRSALRDSMGTEPSARWSEAVDLLQAATARDPNFALAYCLLTEAHLFIYRWGSDHSPARLAAAKEAAETALKLEPALEEARLAFARYFYDGLSDYRRTQSELSLIPESGAHPADYYTMASLVQRRLGLWSESIQNGEKAVELDPQAPQLAFNLVQTFSGLKRYDEAERVANAALFRMPARISERLWFLKSELEYARGNLPAAHQALDAMSNKDNMEYPMARLSLYLSERNTAAARAIMAESSPEQKKAATYWLTVGTLARTDGNAEEARSAFEETRRAALEFLEKRPDAPEALAELAFANAALGNKEEALRAAQRAGDATPKGDALAGPMMSAMLAQVYAWSGDRERAFDLLTELVKVPFGPRYGDLKLDPAWDDLRDDPRFDRLIAEAAALVSSQNKTDSDRR